MFKRLYGDEWNNKYRTAADKRHPIISRYKTAGVTTWCLTKTNPPNIAAVMNLQTRTAHFLKKYSGQINGLKHDPETAQFEVLHKILEVNGVDLEDGLTAVQFAEQEFQNMRNTRPREGTKRKGLGVLWYDGGKGGSKLWYDAVSAEPVIAKKLGVVIRDRKAEEEERKNLASYNIDENWKPHMICAQFEFMPELPDVPALANWIQENIYLSWLGGKELHPRDNDHAWTIAYTAIDNDLVVSTDNGFAGPRTLEK